MPPLIFDFAAIASHMRKDDFYTPTPKAEPVEYYQCHECFTWLEPQYIHDGAATCPNCGSFNRCYFP